MKFKSHLLIILVILGSAVLMNQVSQPLAIIQANTDVEQNEDGTSTESEDGGVYVLQANLAINSSSQVTLHQELHQIREIILDEVADPQPVHETQQIAGTDHFKTLFRKVISTNAP